MAFTGRGGQFEGPRYGWGGVPGDPGAGSISGSAGSRTNFNSGLNSGRYTAGPEAGMRRGEWQWRGHGPSAQRDYGWDYQGGVGREEITMRSEARGGGSYLSHMAQDRSGGLPRYHDDYDAGDRWFPRLGERGGQGYAEDYFRGGRGGTGFTGVGHDEGYRTSGGGVGNGGNRFGREGDDLGGGHRGNVGRGFHGGLAPASGGEYRPGMGGNDYDRGYSARGPNTFGSGNRQAYGGYGSNVGGEYRAQANRGGQQRVTYGVGERQGGGYERDFGQGRALGGRGGEYGRDYNARPLTDDEFYSRVNRW